MARQPGRQSREDALLLSSIAFWWYCNNGVQNILVGIALFEVFHDVQYLSIVWIYNRTRVERDKSIGGFMRFVFRRSGALIGVYIGLIFAYGAIGFTHSAITAEWIRHGLIGLVTASALLLFITMDSSGKSVKRKRARCLESKGLGQLPWHHLGFGRRGLGTVCGGQCW